MWKFPRTFRDWERSCKFKTEEFHQKSCSLSPFLGWFTTFLAHSSSFRCFTSLETVKTGFCTIHLRKVTRRRLCGFTFSTRLSSFWLAFLPQPGPSARASSTCAKESNKSSRRCRRLPSSTSRTRTTLPRIKRSVRRTPSCQLRWFRSEQSEKCRNRTQESTTTRSQVFMAVDARDLRTEWHRFTRRVSQETKPFFNLMLLLASDLTNS